MAWEDILVALRGELAEVRAQAQQRAAGEAAQLEETRAELTSLAGSLGIGDMLSSMNSILLGGGGNVEQLRSWESETDDEEMAVLDDEGENEDVFTNALSWDEHGEREIAVEVVLTSEGIALLVNGIGIRPERDALQEALVEAFREELEI